MFISESLSSRQTLQNTEKSNKATYLIFLCLSLLYIDATNGALRFFLSSIGLAPLVYFPFILGFLSLPLIFFRYARTPLVITCGIFFFLSLTYSFLNIQSINQVLFGFYAWLPFFAGLAFSSLSHQGKLALHFKILWLISVSGVFLDYFIGFPWMGATYEVLGQTVSAARDWDAMGTKRLAGFSRASYSAASQIGIFGLFLLSTYKSRLLKIAIQIISLCAIILTTSKTPMAAFLAASLFALFLGAFTNDRRKKLLYKISYTACFFVLCLVVIIPIIFLGTDSLDIQLPFTEQLSYVTMDTMIQRMTQMWPEALNLITNDQKPYEWVFGRGIGGIGSGQSFGEPLRMNSADNLFIFLYVTFGLFSAFIGAMILNGLSKLRSKPAEEIISLASILVYILTIGITGCVIEAILPLFFIGMLCGLQDSKKNSTSNSASTCTKAPCLL